MRSSVAAQTPHLMITLAALALAACATTGWAAGVKWHEGFAQAQQAAREANKPILVFVHMGATEYRERPETTQGLDSYLRMWQGTFKDANVVNATRGFECLELDLRKRENDELRDRLRVGPVVDTGTGEYTVTGIYPISLFLDHSGRERFRLHGYVPPLAYVVQLRDAKELIECQNAVDRNPSDAVARRNLGRAYMEMYTEAGDRFYEAAIENLEMAIELDPNNETGANYDARVDLAIFYLPDDPQKALGDLFRLQTEDVERRRRFEIQYYMAVAQYAAGNPPAAVELLESFETADRDSPYYNNKWTSLALSLLKLIREDMAGDE